MSAPLANPVLGGGGAIAVEVHALSRELRRLWESAEQPGVLTRACTRNLIALCANAEEAERATSLIAEVAARHAVRAFVVTAAEDAPVDTLEAYVSAHCSLRGGGRHVCCEQITLRVGADARARAAGAVVSLLVPDLPVVVWAVGDVDWRDPFLSAMLDVADRLIVDSRRLSDPHAALAAMAGGEREDAWSPADFEWARTAPWREAVASLFEQGEDAPAPGSLACATIEYGAEGPAVAAALLGGWIADRLQDAREAAATGLRDRVLAGDAAGEEAELDVQLAPHENSPPGMVCGCVLRTDRGAEWRVVRPEAGGALRMDVAGGTSEADAKRPAPRRLPCIVENDGALLADLLDVHGTDPLYERALARAASLLVGTSPD